MDELRELNQIEDCLDAVAFSQPNEISIVEDELTEEEIFELH